MTFMEKLQNIWKVSRSMVCVGLDPDLEKIPQELRNSAHPLFDFNKAIIDATSDLVCAYKPQFAYYSGQGREKDLKLTLAYLRQNHPDIPIILDAKRGDIGATASMYAKEAFIQYQADAVTVNPYMGGDTLKPFTDYVNKGVIILCRTSNPGARELQDQKIQGRPLYQIVAEKATREWNYNQNIALVVGATYPEEIGEIRALIGDIPLLVPGIGAQGGDLQAAVLNGVDSRGNGLIINSSRGIIYSGQGSTFAADIRKAARRLRDAINKHR